MELQTAENKIVKMLEKQNAQKAIEEIREFFDSLVIDNEVWPTQKERQQAKIEQEFSFILNKYNLNQIAINIFSILEKTF